MTLYEEEDEDTLVEEGPQIERGTVFLSDDVKVEKDFVTFNEEEDEDTLVEEGPQIERGTVFLSDTCHSECY